MKITNFIIISFVLIMTGSLAKYLGFADIYWNAFTVMLLFEIRDEIKKLNKTY